MLIPLPARLTLNSFGSIFRLILTGRVPQCDTLTIDFLNLDFIEPTGVTILGNVVKWLRNRDIPVNFINAFENRPAVKYLHDTGFFQIFEDNQSVINYRTSMTSLEFMSAEQGLFWAQGEDILSWLVSNSGCDRACFRELSVCFVETFQNIRDHAGINFGSTQAQYFPSTSKLRISIADIGFGIPEKVRSFLGQDLNDSDCIIEACKYGFTTSNNVGNSGRGLANLTDIVTQHYDGEVVLISDKGFVRYSSKRKALHSTNREWIYPGTLIDIEIDAQKIPPVEEAETYSW